MLEHGKLDPVAYSVQEGILYRHVIEGGQSFQAIYIPKTPESLIQSILKAAHDESGHNGFPRTYSTIRRLYYWKGIKEDVLQHCCRELFSPAIMQTAVARILLALYLNVLGNVVRWCASSLLGSYIHQELI